MLKRFQQEFYRKTLIKMELKQFNCSKMDVIYIKIEQIFNKIRIINIIQINFKLIKNYFKMMKP